MPKVKKRGTPIRNFQRQVRVAVKLRHPPGKRLKQLACPNDLGKPGSTLRLSPLIQSLAPKKVDELLARARQMNPTVELPDFSSWYQVEPPQGVDPDDLVKALRKLDNVETAYAMRVVPPPGHTSDDSWNATQGYLDAAPNGVDARYAWNFAGGDGAGIGFIDMERGWNLNHKDLATAGITLISGTNYDCRKHGTAVLGVVLMVDDKAGGGGVAPAASGRVVSQWRTACFNTADAILSAVSSMSFGDVLLLETQELDPAGAKSYWPVEVADVAYDAILLATALGVVVVEPGGNGGHDLDTYKTLSDKNIFHRNSPDFRDSGAIVVGGGSSTNPHTRLRFSNYGTRIDCFAWAENIYTTTTNNAGTDNSAYTEAFGGTSGAAPIVAGAALIVQGLAQASLGRRFSPRELRQILTTNGTQSATPATDGIGVMPDLRAIINDSQLGLATYIR